MDCLKFKQTRKEIGTEIWESKDDKNFYGKKILIFINLLTGKEETFVLQNSKIDLGWKINNEGIALQSPEISYGMNGFRRANWIERKLNEQNNEDLD